MGWYNIDFDCPSCGQVHILRGMAQIPDGPTRGGNLAELHSSGELPKIPGWMFETATWCDQASAYVTIDDPARAFVWPRDDDHAYRLGRVYGGSWVAHSTPDELEDWSQKAQQADRPTWRDLPQSALSRVAVEFGPPCDHKVGDVVELYRDYADGWMKSVAEMWNYYKDRV